MTLPPIRRAPRPRLTLYTREGCCLCRTALAALHRLGAEFDADLEVVNIDSENALVRAYGTLIPVVALNGRVVARGRLNERWLRLRLRWLRAKG